jgi:predicted DNA-binding ribbon-helix-helix protein
MTERSKSISHDREKASKDMDVQVSTLPQDVVNLVGHRLCTRVEKAFMTDLTESHSRNAANTCRLHAVIV